MAYVFIGVDKIITFDTSTVLLDIQDLWSRYVEWLEISDNSKYLQGMRIVGGDLLPGSKQLGITYFMLNGWKIRPYEETHVLTVDGNLYSDDGSSPFTSVIGAYNVMVINTVSNLVDSTVQQLPEIEHNSFLGKVTLDVDNGISGTSYPAGTPTSPVNNVEEAIIIANYRGFKVINLLSELTVTTGQDISDFTLKSDSWINVTIEPGAVLDNTNFEKVSLYGEMSGLWNVLIDCWVYDITNFCGWLRGGSFVNVALAPYNIDSSGQSFFDSILPMYPNEPSVLTFNTDTLVSFTNANDVYQFSEMNDGCVLSFGLGSGKIIIDDTCIGGNIFISGVGELINNSNLVIDESLLINTSHIVDAIDMDSNVGKITTRKAVKTGNTLTIYESDNITVWKTFDLSNGGRVEV